MRIRELEIEQFGIFVSREMEFSGNTPHVIYGPNEAGKTTLLQLIRELLFGFAVRNPYAFSEHTGDMAAVATCELADGSRIRFRRRKGRRNEVVGEHLDGGTSIDAAGLNRLLGGASVELFQNVFGFSLAELGAGQQSLERAKLSEALYGGALGGLAGFRQVLEDLGRQHEAMFSPAATKKPINRLLSELRKQSKELRVVQVRPRDYEKLEKDVGELRAHAEQLRKERDTLHRQQIRCEQLTQAMKLWHRRSVLCEELAELEIPEKFPRDGERRYEQCRTLRDQAAAELEEFRQDLHEVCTHLESLSPQSHLLDKDAVVQQLAQQLDKIRGFRRDIVLRQQESRAVKAAVLANLQELDPSWTLDHLQRFHTSVARTASIAAMQDELDGLQQRQRDLLAQRPTLEADIQEIGGQLEALPQEQVASPLVDLVESATEYESRREKLEQYEQQQREVDSRLEALQRKLNAPFADQLPQLPSLSVPMLATVAEFRQRLSEIDQQWEHISLRLERANAELVQRQQELETLHEEDQVPDGETLKDARVRRDTGWSLLRRKYVDGELVPDSEMAQWLGDAAGAPCEAYEQSVLNADQIADQRQQQAEIVARLDQLTRAIHHCERLYVAEQQASAACAAAKEQWRQEWLRLWERSGIRPEGPDAMLDWLRLHSELVDTVAQLDAIHGHHDAQQQWIDQYEARLHAGLDGATSSPAARIAEARRRVKQAQEAAADRKSCMAQLPRKQLQLATLEQELADLAARCEQWQGRWQPLMDEFGFPTSWDVHTATKVLRGLSDARSQQRVAESLDTRVHDMQAGLDQFESDVSALCAETAPHLSDRPAENAVEELAQLLERTRQDLQEQQSLVQQRAKLTDRCDAKQEQLRKELAELSRLLELAGVEREDEVPEVARRVRQWYETKDTLESVEQQLRTVRGDDDQTQFEAALADADAAELDSQQKILKAELERVDQQFNEALQAQGVASKGLQELDRTSHAVALAQDLESTRSQLAETVDRWVPMVLARAFMTRAMERFEREHQPRLLVDVSRLLTQMTLGRYTEISRKLDEQGSLQVHQADGKVKEPHQLSTGTREQLYLAIRMAYVLHYCREAEPLPIVMDDVLVNFDDQRAAATFETLLEVSQHVQLILLTCHQYTLDLVQSRLPDLKPVLLGA